jgi:hypothetical protein
MPTWRPRPWPGTICSTLTGADLTNCNRDNFSATPMQMRFYANAIGKRRSAAPARGLRPVADRRGLRGRGSQHGGPGDLQPDPAVQRLRQLPGHPQGRDPQRLHGRLPGHGRQQQDPAQRELCSRADAAVLGRHRALEPRRHAADRQHRRDHRHLQQHRRQGGRPRPVGLDLGPDERRGPDRQQQPRLDPADGHVRRRASTPAPRLSWARPWRPTPPSRPMSTPWSTRCSTIPTPAVHLQAPDPAADHRQSDPGLCRS